MTLCAGKAGLAERLTVAKAKIVIWPDRRPAASRVEEP
jgi:hypothetical protein